MARPTSQREFFVRSDELPDGLRYEPEWLGVDEEHALLDAIDGLALVEARYREFTAKRRIATFGFGYDFSTNVLSPAPPLPEFLHALRERVADWAALPADAFAQTTVAEYRLGTQLGWHRDVRRFGVVVGVSLGGRARMRLRPYPHRPGDPVRATVLDLEPRSIYVLRDDARWRWQHAISPTKTLRYSITFRTMTDQRRAPPR
jgi:alkylated DNA repair dioxygenase AlkB